MEWQFVETPAYLPFQKIVAMEKSNKKRRSEEVAFEAAVKARVRVKAVTNLAILKVVSIVFKKGSVSIVLLITLIAMMKIGV